MGDLHRRGIVAQMAGRMPGTFIGYLHIWVRIPAGIRGVLHLDSTKLVKSFKLYSMTGSNSTQAATVFSDLFVSV